MESWLLRITCASAGVLVSVLGAGQVNAQPQVVEAEGRRWEIRPRVENGFVEVAWTDSAGLAETALVPLQNLNRPSVELSLKREADDYRYEYRLSNAATASKPIQSWTMVLPVDCSTVAQSPPGWNFGLMRSRIASMGRNLSGSEEGLTGTWYAVREPPAVIEPGKVGEGFSMRNKCSPGVVFAYAFTPWPDDSVLGTFPTSVNKKLVKYLAMEYTGQLIVTVGPYYRPGVAHDDILRSYAERLEEAGSLMKVSADKDHVQSLLRLLPRLRALEDRRKTCEELSLTKDLVGFPGDVVRALADTFCTS